MLRNVLIILLALLLLPLAYAVFRTDNTVPKAQVKAAYSLPNSHFIRWKGAEMHYTDSGNDTAMTVLMIHGFGGSNRDFIVLDSLINHRYRVIRVDMPGFGLSDYPFAYGERTFRDAYSEYFNFLMDTLGIDSCHVMGNSLGGLMSLELAAQHPQRVRSLVLFNSAGYDMMEVLKSANAYVLRNPVVKLLVRKGMSESMTERGMRRVVYSDTLLTEEKVRRVNMMWNREGNMRHLVEMANTAEEPDEEMIRSIGCPTLIIWGRDDQIINVKYAERFHRDIQGSRLVIYDRCGHVPMLERPQEVCREVMGFLPDGPIRKETAKR